MYCRILPIKKSKVGLSLKIQSRDELLSQPPVWSRCMILLEGQVWGEREGSSKKAKECLLLNL